MLLLVLLLLPLLAALAILVGLPARLSALFGSGLSLALGLVLAGQWHAGQDISAFSLTVLEKPRFTLALGLPDSLSLTVMLLSVIVLFCAVLSARAPEGRERLTYGSLLLIGAGALGAFLSTDLFFFYAFHELALIPTFLTIGLLGRGARKEAAWKITLYLALGSIVLLAGLVAMVSLSGASSFLFADVLAGHLPTEQAGWVAALLLVGFGSLVSLFPFHSWAAPAYQAAPPSVAMLHAGVLKKFGLYGLLRLMPLIGEGVAQWVPVLVVLLLGNVLWMGLVTIHQRRLDGMLGCSSVMHMGYLFLAVAAVAVAWPDGNGWAQQGAQILIFGHGISIALLFALAGRVEQMTGTLDFEQLGGLAARASQLALFFGLGTMASLGLPGLANFAGEVMIFLGGFFEWKEGQPWGWLQWGTVLSLWGVVMSAVYGLRAFRRVFQGPLRSSCQVESRGLGWSLGLAALILSLALLKVGIYPRVLLEPLAPVEVTPVEATASSASSQPGSPSP